MSYKQWLKTVFWMCIIYIVLGGVLDIFTVSSAISLEQQLNATQTLVEGNNDVYVTRTFIKYDDLGLTRDEFNTLCMTVFGEANLETFDGQQYVAEVVMNRVEARGFGYTVKDVVYAPYQFDSINLDSWGSYNQTNADAVIQALMNNELSDDILYFHNPSGVNTVAYCEKYGLEVVFREDDHVFMR